MKIFGRGDLGPVGRFSIALAAILFVTALVVAGVSSVLLDRYVQDETSRFTSDAVASLPVLTRQRQPWWLAHVLRGDIVLASRLEELPDEALAEKTYLRQRGVRSAASIPLKVNGQIAGAVSYSTTHREMSWTPDLVNQLRALGDILWNALKRRQAMQALLEARESARESEERFRKAFDHAPIGIALVRPDGKWLRVNRTLCEIVGYSEEELLSQIIEAVTQPEIPPDVTEVRIMSLHKSKGLSSPIVVIAGCSRFAQSGTLCRRSFR